MGITARIAACFDLLQRYGIAFGGAWRQRHERATEPRLPYEAQFLPAALSLQETPVSPAPRIAMWLLILFAVLAVVWSVYGRIDVVATAHGKIVSNDRTKTIQPLETGVVRAIHVTDGQSVRTGEILIELDATTANADKERITGDLTVLRLQVARAQAMLAALVTGKPPSLDMQSLAGIENSKITESQRLLRAQFEEYRAKLARNDAERAQREAERRSTQERVRKLEQTVPIARQRAADYRNLIEQNFVPQHGYLDHEQVRIEQEADLATQSSMLEEIDVAWQSTRAQRAEIVAETRRFNLDSATDGQQKLAVLEQELKKAIVRAETLHLVAPVDGTVQQLAVHTIGGVVTPAQPLMVIVPRDHPLEVEAFIENKDIGFVKADQEAEVKVETFQYTKYGTIDANVTSVSHDAINDEKRGLIYSTRVKMKKSNLLVDGTEVKLSPGMAVSVEIKTGKRRVIEYFLSPLIQHTRESLRER